jgi:hypothetical protein
MRLRNVIALLRQVPERAQDRQLVLFGPNGVKFQVREDISQLDVQGGKILLHIEPTED